MGFSVYNRELTDKVDTDLLDEFLDISKVTIGVTSEHFSQVIKINHKQTTEGKPFISFTFKDINGDVVYGNWFDQLLDTSTLREITKQKNLFAKIRYEGNLFNGSISLNISNVNFILDSEVSASLADAFASEYKQANEVIERLKKVNFGPYNTLNEGLKNSGIYDSIKRLSMEEYGPSKIGYLAKIIEDAFYTIDNINCNRYLVKATLLYSLYFYNLNKTVSTFDFDNKIGKSLANLYKHLATIRGTLGDSDEIYLFCQESERLVLSLFGIPHTKSVNSLIVEQVLSNIKRMYEITSSCSRIPSGGVFQLNRDTVLNI